MTTPSNTDVPATPFGFGRGPATDDRAEAPVRVPEPGSGFSPADAATGPGADEGIMFNSVLSRSSDGRRRRGHARTATVAAGAAPTYGAGTTAGSRRISNRTALIAGVGLLALAGIATGAIWALSQNRSASVTDQAAIDRARPGLGAATVATNAGRAAADAARALVPAGAPAAVPVEATPVPVAPARTVRRSATVRSAPAATERAAPVAVTPEGTAPVPIESAPPSRQPEPIVITPPAEPAPVVVAPDTTPPPPPREPEPGASPQG